MSFFERNIGGFLRSGKKTTVDPAVPGGIFPVEDLKAEELLQEILTELKTQNAYLAEIVGEELKP